MAARLALTALLSMGFLLAGVIQYEISAALIKFSAADYAQYIADAGYATLYCKDYDVDAAKIEESEFSEEATAVDGSGSREENERGLFEGQYYQGNRSDWRRNMPEAKVPLTEEGRWEHNLYEAFLWGSLFGPLIGSLLVSHLGPKKILEGGLLGASVATLLVPAAWKTLAHFGLSIAQGVCTSMMWPAAHVFAARWYPPDKRSTYISCYASWTAGWALAALLGALLLNSLGRDAVFYTTSLLIVFWYIAWQKYVTDLPPIPPNISWTERSLINTVPEDFTPEVQTANYQEQRFPLKAFMLSGPLWACAIACYGSHWGLTTLLLAATKYLQIVYGYSFSHDEALSYLPFLGHLLCAFTFGFLADNFREASGISTTTLRKILVYISHFLPGAIIFVIGYTGCDPSAPPALFTAALCLIGATSSGVYTSALEISPKYSGMILGAVQSFGAAGALSASYVVKECLYGSLPGTWCLIFGVCSTVLVITAAVFLIYGSGTEQKWDHALTGVLSMLSIRQTNCDDPNDQPNELHQQNQPSEGIDQINRKNQVFSL